MFPRYGGYSESGLEEVSSYGSFPCHGGYSLGNNDLVKKGYVVSPFRGLFYYADFATSNFDSCFPVIGVILDELKNAIDIKVLFPYYRGGILLNDELYCHLTEVVSHYRGYSAINQSECAFLHRCFPITGVILAMFWMAKLSQVVSLLRGLFSLRVIFYSKEL